MLTILCMFWTFGSFAIVCAKILQSKKSRLTPVINSFLVYGKTNKIECHPLFDYLRVPKRWFIHFYITGVIINSYSLYITWNIYMHKDTPPKYLLFVLQFLKELSVGGKEEASIDQSCAVLLIALMFIQNTRRLYECLFVSVYSKGTMNIAHYTAGILMYSTFHISVLLESPNLNTGSENSFNIAWWQTIGLTLFLWSSWQQYQVHHHLASLRTNRQGKVVSYQHYIPEGGWFSLVSNPHYFMEMLIYFSFLLVTGFHHWTLCSIALFVCSNQITAGYMSHMWYQTEFSSYPKYRKAVIPYLF